MLVVAETSDSTLLLNTKAKSVANARTGSECASSAVMLQTTYPPGCTPLKDKHWNVDCVDGIPNTANICDPCNNVSPVDSDPVMFKAVVSAVGVT